MIFNYPEVCEEIVQDLPARTRGIILDRFGLVDDKRKTLEQIGKNYNISRERVRQIEKKGIEKIRPKVNKYSFILDFFSNQLESSGKIRREDSLLNILGPNISSNYIFFILSLADGFDRFPENEDFYTLWTNDKDSLGFAEKAIKEISKRLTDKSRLVDNGEIESFLEIMPVHLFAFLEVSKKIQKSPIGLWGLTIWPEVNPKGIKDKAYIVLRRKNKPLHFVDVARLLNEDSSLRSQNRKSINMQTVHNELIKDSRFVLVGRGLYALREWGYEPGTTKDIIVKILKDAGKPLSRDEIVKRVSAQRFIERNTILLNLRNASVFGKDINGDYKLRT